MSKLPGYDAWLERPFQQREAESERFMDWCDQHNIEYDNPDAELMYQEWVEEQYKDYPDDYDDEFIDDWLEADYENRNGDYDD